ncbi:hypothetical protein LINGRAHAP2_LOCUS8820 [Linum grandiflorum]
MENDENPCPEKTAEEQEAGDREGTTKKEEDRAISSGKEEDVEMLSDERGTERGTSYTVTPTSCVPDPPTDTEDEVFSEIGQTARSKYRRYRDTRPPYQFVPREWELEDLREHVHVKHEHLTRLEVRLLQIVQRKQIDLPDELDTFFDQLDKNLYMNFTVEEAMDQNWSGEEKKKKKKKKKDGIEKSEINRKREADEDTVKGDNHQKRSRGEEENEDPTHDDQKEETKKKNKKRKKNKRDGMEKSEMNRKHDADEDAMKGDDHQKRSRGHKPCHGNEKDCHGDKKPELKRSKMSGSEIRVNNGPPIVLNLWEDLEPYIQNPVPSSCSIQRRGVPSLPFCPSPLPTTVKPSGVDYQVKEFPSKKARSTLNVMANQGSSESTGSRPARTCPCVVRKPEPQQSSSVHQPQYPKGCPIKYELEFVSTIKRKKRRAELESIDVVMDDQHERRQIIKAVLAEIEKVCPKKQPKDSTSPQQDGILHNEIQRVNHQHGSGDSLGSASRDPIPHHAGRPNSGASKGRISGHSVSMARSVGCKPNFEAALAAAREEWDRRAAEREREWMERERVWNERFTQMEAKVDRLQAELAKKANKKPRR